MLAAVVALTCAANAARGQTVSGVGTRQCSAYTFALEKRSEAAIDAYLAWAQGYLSGVNATSDGRIDVQIDHGGLLHWLAGYCGSHPRAYFYEAMAEVVSIHR